MDLLLDPLFKSLACEHQLCRAAAGKCAGALRDFVGPGIFAGHLSDAQAASMSGNPDVPPPSGVALLPLSLLVAQMPKDVLCDDVHSILKSGVGSGGAASSGQYRLGLL